jgi:hypothetical protein
MPVLENPRQEKFAQFLAMGKTRIEAHEMAGYTPNSGNATTLARQPHIKARLAELQGNVAEIATHIAGAATGISKAWVLERLRENAAKGLKEKKASSVATRCLELIGRELGMFTERVETGKPGDFAHLSDEELDAQISQRLKARGISDRQVRNFLLVTTNPPANSDDEDAA